MPIEMPKGLPFSVDTWTPSSRPRRHHFLTHTHKDHSQGIVTYASYPIYSTLLTKTLVLRNYPQLDESLFVEIEVGQSIIVDDFDCNFTVTAFDANHCPGAVMYLFEGNFGNVLHTGDCRLTAECLQNLPEKYIGRKGKEPESRLDYLFLDCTFGQFSMKMPSRHMAIQQIINCIRKHPDAPTVYLTCDMLGQEEILVEVSRTFGCKIFVDKSQNQESYSVLELLVPEILSQDPCSQFQLFDGFPKLYEKAEAKIAEARASYQQEPLIIRPSAQWYACDEEAEKQRKEKPNQAVRDNYGVWHVCYSIHSSREELEWALHLLSPKWVISTTPSCRAMELNYVKKHCFKNRDSLWKLLDIGVVSAAPDVLTKSLTHSSEFKNEKAPESFVEHQSEPIVISTTRSKRLSVSPPNKRLSITLFGRARLGLQDYILDCEREEDEIVSTSSDPTDRVTAEKSNASFKPDEVVEVDCVEPLDIKRSIEYMETKCSSKEIHKCDAVSPIGSSKGYNANLRKFYRSMNVPVPRPLPSLVELSKRAKRRL